MAFVKYKSEWQRRREGKRDFWRAIFLAPVILVGAGVLTYGYLILLKYCGLL